MRRNAYRAQVGGDANSVYRQILSDAVGKTLLAGVVTELGEGSTTIGSRGRPAAARLRRRLAVRAFAPKCRSLAQLVIRTSLSAKTIMQCG
jgi:hypothetical protein